MDRVRGFQPLCMYDLIVAYIQASEEPLVELHVQRVKIIKALPQRGFTIYGKKLWMVIILKEKDTVNTNQNSPYSHSSLVPN